MIDQAILLRQQYQHIQSARRVLLGYCSGLTKEDLLQENSSFGRGSISNLLVHIANTYKFWVGQWAMQQEMVFTDYSSQADMALIEALFTEVDQLMDAFLTRLVIDDSVLVAFEIDGRKQEASTLQLFTHVITHEFHHKGQILSLSRHLSYTPVDTDVLR